MTGTANVALRDARIEQVALDIYEIAYRTMEVITRRMVDRELGRLRSHPPDCRCPEPCQAAKTTPPARVYSDRPDIAELDHGEERARRRGIESALLKYSAPRPRFLLVRCYHPKAITPASSPSL